MELDATLRHVSRLSNPEVPAYTTLDLRWAWQARPELEFSVSGQNLFDGGHGEFTDPSTRSEFGPGVFVRLSSRF
jgi:iron complex outermembrane receptor protein